MEFCQVHYQQMEKHKQMCKYAKSKPKADDAKKLFSPKIITSKVGFFSSQIFVGITKRKEKLQSTKEARDIPRSAKRRLLGLMR